MEYPSIFEIHQQVIKHRLPIWNRKIILCKTIQKLTENEIYRAGENHVKEYTREQGRMLTDI